MKILEAFGEPISNGGQESFVVNAVSHMKIGNNQIDLLTPYYCDNPNYERIIHQQGGKVYSLGLVFNPGGDRRSIVKPLGDFFSQHRYDIVHVHSGSISILALVSMVAKKNNVSRVIVHSHCGIEKITLKNTVLRYLAYLYMKNNVNVFCACSYEAAIAKYPKRIAEKAIILKNGVDTDLFKYNPIIRAAMRTELGLKDEETIIGHVGRFNYQKNHSFMIEVFRKYKENHPNAYLMLIGSGELLDKIKEKVQSYGLNDNVKFIGNVDNVQDYMQAMDTFILPSNFEGLPIVGVEAQAAGLQVIVSQNVSRELAITENVKFSRSFSTEEWTALIDEAITHERNDPSEDIEKAGFGIASTAKQMQNLYN